MERDSFPPGVAEQLNWYVYRLIDPRNGETFYVGKGRGDRIFQHANGALSKKRTKDPGDLKSQRLKEIRAGGFKVAHVIHRHHIENEQVAYQIEAAVIDAYPGLTNIAGGHGNHDYGSKHVEQIVSGYSSQPFKAREPLILISIAHSFKEEERSIYDAVRYAWKIDVTKAQKIRLVLAHRQGLVIGAFRPKRWLKGTRANFPEMGMDRPDRWGFEGKEAGERTASNYVRKLVPAEYRPKGASNPIRYVTP